MKGKIRYQREIQKSYMIAMECREELIENFCGQMVLRGRIKNLIKCEMRFMNGQREMWYDISSLQTLEQIFAIKEMSFSDLQNLICQIIQVLKETEKFLIDARQLCFEPEYLYMDMENGQIRFLFDYTEENTESSMCRLAEFILERTCHEEEKAVEVAYLFYECAGKENFPIEKIENYLEEKEEKREQLSNTKEREEHQEQKGYEWEEVTSYDENISGEDREETKEDKRPFSWNSNNGKIIETGLVCIFTAVILLVGFFGIQKYFVLERLEKILYLSLIGVFIIIGIIIFLYGFFKERKKTERNISDNKLAEKGIFGKSTIEAELLQCEIEPGYLQQEEGPKSDGKTIYIGKSILNRDYSLIESKKGRETEYPISCYPFLIGKDKERVNLEIKEHSVSRIHARILEEKGDIYIEDLHSTNGTYLNDLPVEPHDKIKLKRGDMIQFGKTEFIFH